MDVSMAIGLAGMIFVFTSFIVKRWLWLYTFNLTGTVLLTIYAYLKRDLIFLVVEAGLVFFLLYRLLNEIRKSSKT
jgi:lipid-A-disaccharide synthase-like uncharacterized protein